MHTQSARRALAYLWALVAVARERPLTAEEKTEIDRLCEILQGTANPPDGFVSAVGGICHDLHPVRVGERPVDQREIDAVLDEIDRLREVLV